MEKKFWYNKIFMWRIPVSDAGKEIAFPVCRDKENITIRFLKKKSQTD